VKQRSGEAKTWVDRDVLDSPYEHAKSPNRAALKFGATRLRVPCHPVGVFEEKIAVLFPGVPLEESLHPGLLTTVPLGRRKLLGSTRNLEGIAMLIEVHWNS
jgi:hypothetical protein